jgi:CheY-like chemotaxis protein
MSDVFCHLLTPDCTETIMPLAEELLSELRSALAHLDDPPYLENHPLTKRLSFISQAPALSRGQLLRRTLRLVIETLDPGQDVPRSAPEARSYEVLQRYAIAKESMIAIASRLDISERQAYRELRCATEALAQILSEMTTDRAEGLALLEAKAPGSAPERAARVLEDIERLSRAGSEELDIVRLVISAVESVRNLARERRLEIELEAGTEPLGIMANRVMLRQAVLNLLSHAVSSQEAGHITVQLDRAEQNATVELFYTPPPDHIPPDSEGPYAVATQILNSLGIRWGQETSADGMRRIWLAIPLAQEHTVLIVDDNEGLIALFRRYLRPLPYRVVGVTRAAEALAMVDQLRPELVILDVMMPDRDGWEVLETLRAMPSLNDGHRLRVIVCSIINDPQLAAALGADAFLHKPVDQASLLHAISGVFSSTE